MSELNKLSSAVTASQKSQPNATPPDISKRLVIILASVIVVTLGGVIGYLVIVDNAKAGKAEAKNKIVLAQNMINQQRVDIANDYLQEILGSSHADEETKVKARTMLSSISGELRRIKEVKTQAERKRSSRRARASSPPTITPPTIAEKSAAVGVGSMFGVIMAVIAILVGCVWLGIAEICLAIRDMAVNSYFSANTNLPSARTPTPAGGHAPNYRFIPFLAGLFRVVAGLQFVAAAFWLVMVGIMWLGILLG